MEQGLPWRESLTPTRLRFNGDVGNCGVRRGTRGKSSEREFPAYSLVPLALLVAGRIERHVRIRPVGIAECEKNISPYPRRIFLKYQFRISGQCDPGARFHFIFELTGPPPR